MAKKKTAKKVTRRNQTSAELPRAYQEALQKGRTQELGGRYWNPENEGDYIGGKLTSVKEVRGKFGKRMELTLETVPEGALRTVTCGTVLDGLVRDMNIAPGEEIVIVYRGTSKGKGKKGRPAKLFTLNRLSEE